MFIKQSINILFLFSILLIVTMTFLYPLPNSISLNSYIENNYIPFSVIFELLSTLPFLKSMYNIIGNIVLFMPLGFLLPLKFTRINKFNKAVMFGLGSSIFIEFSQLFLPYRQTDIDDVMLNTLGTGLGYVVYKLWINIVKNDN